jgi:hypothetical protein
MERWTIVSYRKDIICARCGHAQLLDEIVKLFEKNILTTELRKELKPLIEKAKQLGFGTDEVKT